MKRLLLLPTDEVDLRLRCWEATRSMVVPTPGEVPPYRGMTFDEHAQAAEQLLDWLIGDDAGR